MKSLFQYKKRFQLCLLPVSLKQTMEELSKKIRELAFFSLEPPQLGCQSLDFLQGICTYPGVPQLVQKVPIASKNISICSVIVHSVVHNFCKIYINFKWCNAPFFCKIYLIRRAQKSFVILFVPKVFPIKPITQFPSLSLSTAFMPSLLLVCVVPASWCLG